MLKKITMITLFALIIIVLLFIIINSYKLGVININFITNNENIIKKSVTLREIEGKSYIICTPTRTTGFEWELLEDENGNCPEPYVILTGVNPQKNLSYDFLIADNKFIFYVVEKRFYTSDATGDCTEYIVDGWDILYPVRHGGFFEDILGVLFGFNSRYITKSDLSS